MKMKKGIKILLISILSIFIFTGVVRLILPWAAVRIANRQLPELLNTGASIGSLKLGLLRGYVSIEDLRVSQPEGFGEGDLIVVPTVRVKLQLASLLSPPLTVQAVHLIDCEVDLVKNRDDVMNLDVILAGLTGEDEPESLEEEAAAKAILVQLFSVENLSFSYTDYAITAASRLIPEVDGDEEGGEEAADDPADPAVEEEESGPAAGAGSSDQAVEDEESLDEIVAGPVDPAVEDEEGGEEVDSGPVDLVVKDEEGEAEGIAGPADPAVEAEEGEAEVVADLADLVAELSTDNPGAKKEEKSLRIRISDLNLMVENLLIAPGVDPGEVDPARSVLTARILQDPFPAGYLGLNARIGPVGTGLPPLNAVIRLGALELKPLDVVIPAGTALALGGSAMDIAVDLALTPDLLDCKINVEVAGGHVIPLAIGGTLDQPEVDTSSLLFGVILHLGGGVGRLAGNIGGAGYQLAAGAAETTWAVGKGAVNVVGSVGGGLFKTLTSVATGDFSGAVDGLSDTTVGTAKAAAAAAGGVAGEVAQGASATAGTTIGADDDFRWRDESPRRWEESWADAQQLLEEMPFPPVPRKTDPPFPVGKEPVEEESDGEDAETEVPPFNGNRSPRPEKEPGFRRGGLRPAR